MCLLDIKYVAIVQGLFVADPSYVLYPPPLMGIKHQNGSQTSISQLLPTKTMDAKGNQW